MFYHLFNPTELPCDKTDNDDEIQQLFTLHIPESLNLTISTNLRDIKLINHGQKIVIYLKYHNIGLLCEKIDQTIWLSFYPCLLNNEDVLKHSHVQLKYPSKTITINESELDNHNFTNMITFADTPMDIANNHSKKGSTCHTEIRASKDPTAFLQLLFDRITYQEEVIPQITKHYHDEIRWNNSKSCFRRSGLLFFLKAVVKHTFINTLQDGEMKYKQFIIEILLQNVDNLCDNMLHWANKKITRKIKKFKQLYNNTYFDDKFAVINKSKINESKIDESPSFLHINNLTLQDCKFDIDIDMSTLPVIINGEKLYLSYTDKHLNLYQQLFINLKSVNPENLFSRFNDIINKCEDGVSNHDPLFISRSVHCCLKILQVMHASLLTRHKTMNRQILRKKDIVLFRFILTENHQERRSLHDIEQYFVQYQDEAPFVLDDSYDFALQYVQDHFEEYIEWKTTIQIQEQKLIREKHNEYDEKNKQYKAVIARNNPYNCRENCLRNKMSRNNTLRNQYLCNYHKFEDQREKDRDIEISCHERMLPNSEEDKKKVAFEYICPQELIDFRDMVGKLLCVLYNDSSNITIKQPDKIHEIWTSPRHHDGRSYRSYQDPFIQLVSTCKSVERSHYAEKHITNIGSDLIQDNCWNINFSLDTSNSINESYFERKTLYSMTSPYFVNLSKYNLDCQGDDIDNKELSLIRLRDDENTVIASFEAVDHSITLEEYQTIATIRVGECLQLYNIWNAIKSDAPIMHKAVINIIKQSIYAFGSQNTKKSSKEHYRSHIALYDSEFLKNLKDLIYKWINDYSETWNKYRYMESILCVLNLIQEEISCEREYITIREVCTKWITTILKQERFEIIYQLYSIIIQTYRYLDFTQNNIAEYIDKIERYYFYKNKIGNKDYYESYILYENFKKIKDSTINHAIAFQSYIGETNELIHRWNNQWLIAYNSSIEYAICFLTGEYRIDGFLCGTIPKEIKNTSKYKTLFGSESLQVTRKNNYYVHKYEKDVSCNINFYQDSIIQVFNTKTSYMFLDSLNVEDNVLIPKDINKLYKWININTKVIEFRTKKLDPASTEYCYINNKIQTNYKQSIVVKNHRDIMVALDSMTNKSNIIVIMDNTNEQLNVSIKVENSYVFQLIDIFGSTNKGLYLESLDAWVHRDFDVFDLTVPKLTLKCLTTNETFIMLKRKNYLNKQDTFNFFTYTVNNVTHMLDSKSRESYLFLGYTFGFSHCATKRDQFTLEYGQTMSKTILENYGYPSDLYNSDEQQIIDWIGELSPCRNYYPEHLKEMEVVEFSVDWLSSSDWYIIWAFKMNEQHNIICERNNVNKWTMCVNTQIHLNRRSFELRESHTSKQLVQTVMTFKKFPLLERLNDRDTVKRSYSNCFPEYCGKQVSIVYHSFKTFLNEYPMETWHTLEYEDIIDSLVQITLSTIDNEEYEWMLQYLIYQSLSKSSRWPTNSRGWIGDKLRYQSLASDYAKLLPSRISNTKQYLSRYQHHHYSSMLTYPDDYNSTFINKKVNGSTVNYLNSIDTIDLNFTDDSSIYCVKLHTGKQNKLNSSVFRNNWLKFLNEISTNSATNICDILTQQLLNTIQDSSTSYDMESLPKYWKWIQLCTSKIIRPKQIKIAKHMINSKSSLQTQLNMGEGKTSIIMPMLCMYILKETDTIPRINVLKPLLKTNLEYFHCVFGFMGIKLYNDYCDRLSNPYRLYEYNSIYITSWESRMSQLILSNIQNNIIDGPTFTEILDESDEIFHPNNSLVYPIGEPKLVDGGSYRWKTWFAIFEALANVIHTQKLQEVYPNDLIVQTHSDTNKFPVITITQFGRTFRKKLNRLLQDFIFSNNTELKIFSSKDRELFSQETFQHQDYYNEKKCVMLTLFGAMRYKILHDSLLKRHRVNYGIDRSRKSLVAVPFRGKEYPSHNSEYSQPDAIIALTCQSYYLDGLTDDQVYQVLKDVITNKVLNVGYTPIQYQTINIEDPCVLKQYCQQYRFNMNFCNYYMNKFVFPTFAKQFPEQYQATTWNLTCNTFTMGFSGTNGMQHLLPPMIVQNDIDKVKMTNTYMDMLIAKQQLCNSKLMEQFNNPLDAIMSASYNKTYLKLNVLIDAGGDVNDRGELVARRWLQSRHDMLACLFYWNDEQYIVDRYNVKQKRHQSNFACSLNKVLIYLDDQHTRGVDLKIPHNTTAMVTIGDGLTRDKLMQACMRMRGLIVDTNVQKIHGQHHVIFFQSPKVRSVMKKNRTFSILEYCYDCTNDMIKKMLYIHGMNGRKFQSNNKIISTPDFSTLDSMYGKPVKNQLLLDIFADKDKDQHIVDCIDKHCDKNNIYSSSMKHMFSCNQEQERELEQELEEDRIIERPPPYNAANAYIRPCIKNLLHNEFQCRCQTPCWESCNKYIGLKLSDGVINVSHQVLNTLVIDVSKKLKPNIRNQLVWCYSKQINNINNYLFITYHEANYLMMNNIHIQYLSGFVPQLFKTNSLQIPKLTWNHVFDQSQIATLSTIFLILRSRFVPDQNYLTTFLEQFDIPSLIEYYKTIYDNTDIKNSIDEVSIQAIK